MHYTYTYIYLATTTSNIDTTNYYKQRNNNYEIQLLLTKAVAVLATKPCAPRKALPLYTKNMAWCARR